MCNHDILSALYCSRHGKHHPLVFVPAEIHGKFSHYYPHPQESVVPVAFCGFGFTLISRRIISRMAKAHGHPLVIWPREIKGEDVNLCERATALGATCGVDCRISVGHRAVVTVAWNIERRSAEYSTHVSEAFAGLAQEA